MDGSGEETQLRITVKGRRQYTLTKMGFEYGISSGAPTELLGDVSKALAERPWVKDGGYYVLVPEDFSNSMWKGVLEIYPTGKEEEPLMGIYETVPVEDENGDTYALWQFTYNGEKRLFTRTVSGNGKCVLAENVTPFVLPVCCPKVHWWFIAKCLYFGWNKVLVEILSRADLRKINRREA